MVLVNPSQEARPVAPELDPPPSRRSSLSRYLWEIRWWWITPLAVLVVLYLAVVLASDVTGIAPFLYTLF